MINLDLFKDRQFLGSVLIVSTGYVFLIGVMVLLNTNDILSKMPERQGKEAEPLVNKQVYNKLIKQQTKINAYSIKVKYGVDKISSSFSSLYKAAVPFVFTCALLGFTFTKKRKAKVHTLPHSSNT
ncbi:hypothetical protein ACLHDF_22510 [Priestia aryabhattai]|uniref:hypothetical protein n=1 Tax=Priestia megaterium TaxID=1404 RepID=UPI0039B9616F